MATVFLAYRDEPSGPPSGPWALKVIREEYAQNSQFSTMFADEAKLATRMRHHNVVRVEESGQVAGRLFLSMEVLVGQSFWQVWQACRERGVRIRYDLAAWIGARAADGLHHAHELRGDDGLPLRVVHRDINQSNIFITYDGDVKVIDFGLAKAANRVSQTAAGVVKGKLSYLAPEQTTGGVLDCRADIFALGVTLWEVTVDRRLFKGRDDVDTLLRVHQCHVPDATELVEGYPPELWRIVKRCLAKDREARYPTAHALATDLDVFTRSEGQGIGRDSVAEVMRNLFPGERERQERWFASANKPSLAIAPLRTEATALLMKNMPSIPPPPKVDLWLATAPPVFAPRAQPASRPTLGADAAEAEEPTVIDEKTSRSLLPEPEDRRGSHHGTPRRPGLVWFAVTLALSIVVGLVVFFAIRMLRSQ